MPRSNALTPVQPDTALPAVLVTTPNSLESLLDAQQFDMMLRVAAEFAKSTLVPAHFRGKPADVFVALSLAQRLGLDAFTVLQSIFVVSGRPGMSATLVIGLANRSGIFKGPITFRSAGTGDDLAVTAKATLSATGDTVDATVSMKMAKAEGWTKNPKYQSMPEHMLTYRAATFLVRRYCPEVLLGMQTAEELQDVAAARPVSAPAPDRQRPVLDVQAEPVADTDADALITDADAEALAADLAAAKVDVARLLEFYKVADVDQLTAAQAAHARQVLAKRTRRPPAAHGPQGTAEQRADAEAMVQEADSHE